MHHVCMIHGTYRNLRCKGNERVMSKGLSSSHARVGHVIPLPSQAIFHGILVLPRIKGLISKRTLSSWRGILFYLLLFCYWILGLKFTINLSLKFLRKSLGHIVVGNVPFLYSNRLCLCCYALVRYHETMSFVKRELIWPQDGASCPTLRYRIAASC